MELVAEQPLRGLTRAEAVARRARFGPNEVVERAVAPAWQKLLRQFTHLFAGVLWIAAGLSVVAAWQDPQSGMSALASAIVIVIAVNGVFSFLQEQRAERAVAALRRLLPLKARAVRDGRILEVEARELVPGDVVILEAGDQVPADCRLTAAIGVRVNTSTMTGEAAPEPREPGATVLAGTFLVSGRARAVVFAIGMKTELGRIAELTQAQRPVLSPLQREITRLARIVAVFATALGALFFVVGRLVGLPAGTTLLFGVGILVANVPEGLLPTVTLSLAMASQRMARRNALVRRLPAVEALGSATVICTDKTGTLTQNRMEIAGVFHETPALHEGAALCHDLVVTEAGRRGDPMELALAALGEQRGVQRARRVAELPFDAARKRLTTLHELPRGRVVHTKGAFETVLPLCTLSADESAALLQEAEALADRGLRVLAFASRASERLVEEALQFDGFVAFDDPPRDEVPEAIERCRGAGIRVIMVTGDHPRTAVAVGRRIGLVRAEPQVLTGERLRALSDAELDAAMRAPEVIVARADPADKRLIVESLRRNGDVVAVTGDGANDAPALRDADIGIAMGKSGTDVARDAADLVLLDDNFASIVSAVEEGRAVFANIRKFLTYILTSNVPELVPYLAFVLLGAPLGLTILQILAVDLGTDMLPALALGAEPPHPDTMREPPRRRGQRLFDKGLLARAYFWLGLLEAAGAMTAFFGTLLRGGWHWGTPASGALYVEATTACLAAIVIMQVANVLLCRSEHEPVLLRGIAQNPFIVLGIAVELTLLVGIVYLPPLQSIFQTGPLHLHDWIFAVPFAGAMILLEQLRKLYAARAGRTRCIAR